MTEGKTAPLLLCKYVHTDTKHPEQVVSLLAQHSGLPSIHSISLSVCNVRLIALVVATMCVVKMRQ